MSVQIRGSSGNLQEVDANTLAGRVTVKPPTVGTLGAYRVCATSGLLTTVAAGTASAGHIFAARWSHATQLFVLTRFRAKWTTVAGFTAAQEVGMDLFITRNYTASHSGGTAITLTGNEMKKDNTFGSSNMADIRIGNTGALTNGTHTISSAPIAQDGFAELAAGAAIPKGGFQLFISDEDLRTHPIVLRQNEGLILRNSILMGAGGTARVQVEMDWLELASF